MMQFQAGILGAPVERPAVPETTALGAAYLAGLAIGFWEGRAEITRRWKAEARFAPTMDERTRGRLSRDWKRAVDRALQWEET